MGKYHYLLEMDLFLDKIDGGEKNSKWKERAHKNYPRSRNKWRNNVDDKRKYDQHPSYDSTNDAREKTWKIIAKYYVNIFHSK